MTINPIKDIDLHREARHRTITGTELLKLTYGNEIECLTIADLDVLTQVIGYGMYHNGNRYDVYLRGQTDLYAGSDGKVPLIPSLYRKVLGKQKRTDAFNRRINEYLEEKKLYNAVKTKEKLVPLLQHYGIRTNQIDVVDNLWVALWFAVHEAKSVSVGPVEYIHFYETEKEYCYLFLIATDARDEDSKNTGVYMGKETVLTDLRKALPSYFVRPHAQHAFMIKKKEEVPDDYTDLIVGIIRIPVKKALEWIGTGTALSTEGLFPPVTHDPGYAELIKRYKVQADDVKNYGSIQVITGK